MDFMTGWVLGRHQRNEDNDNDIVGETVYVISGIYCGDDGAYNIISETAIHKTLQGAKQELQDILHETYVKADEMGYEFEADMKSDQLIIDYETGAQETFTIYEKTIYE